MDMNGLASLYPPPPPYYKLYTAANCEKLEQYRGKNAKKVPKNNKLIPELLPPPPPSGQTYRNFGSIWNVKEQLPSLSDSGITQLYEDGSEKTTASLTNELKKLLYSALLAYTGLIQTLSVDATKFGDCVERLQILFINMHHLLNTYRPLQSQETMILKMEDQISMAKRSAEEIRISNEGIKKKLITLEKKLPQKPEPIQLTTSGTRAWSRFELDIDLIQSKEETAVE